MQKSIHIKRVNNSPASPSLEELLLSSLIEEILDGISTAMERFSLTVPLKIC